MRPMSVRRTAMAIGACLLVLAGIGPSHSTTHPRPIWGFPLTDTHKADISRPFSVASHTSPLGLRGHRGVDFPATMGTPIHSIGAGVVYFVGVISGKPTISIDHGELAQVLGHRIRSTYEPVVSDLNIGDRITHGQLIGHTALGNSHCSGLCVHLGIKVAKDHYIDPQLLWSESPLLLPSARG